MLCYSDPSRENSQSSTDTASSAESTPLSAPSSEIKIKQEPVDISDSGTVNYIFYFKITIYSTFNIAVLSYM